MTGGNSDQKLRDELARMQQSSNVLLALMDSSDRGVAIITPNLRLAAANAAFRQWFPQESAEGRLPLCNSVLYDGSTTLCLDRPATRCMQTGEKQEALVTRTKGGSADGYRLTCTPLYSAGGELLGVLEIAARVGELHEKELQQYAAQLEAKVLERTAELTASQQNLQQKIAELDAANSQLKANRDRLIRSEKLAAVGEMSATVAHGIRNPLVSIGGFARRLMKKEQPDESSLKYLRIIIDEIDRLETILSELLDFVRPRKLELRSVFLGSIIEDALKGFAGEFARHSIRVEMSLHPDLPAMDIDEYQFRHVLQNLFRNSIDAMPEGGVLQVTTDLENGSARVSIADTGAGIDEKNVEKIFHPFFTTKPSGTGLGLAVCNQIIAIHGGHIRLQRRLPLGIVFDIYLPLTRPEADVT